MARIRTIKPGFFKHGELYDAEQEAGLPLRLAFAGLWTVADREGKFKWKPREIKLDVLPYDNVDFAAVLAALAKYGFLLRYKCAGEEFGFIPTFKEHQQVNPREAASIIPDPDQISRVSDASTTRENVDCDAHCEEGKGTGREGKGRELVIARERFEDFWKNYPQEPGMSKPEAEKAWLRLPPEDHVQAVAALPAYKSLLKDKDQRVLHPCRFLSQRRFDSFKASEPLDPAKVAAAKDRADKLLGRGKYAAHLIDGDAA